MNWAAPGRAAVSIAAALVALVLAPARASRPSAGEQPRLTRRTAT